MERGGKCLIFIRLDRVDMKKRRLRSCRAKEVMNRSVVTKTEGIIVMAVYARVSTYHYVSFSILVLT